MNPTKIPANMTAYQWEQVRLAMIIAAETVPEDLSWPIMETFHALARQVGYSE